MSIPLVEKLQACYRGQRGRFEQHGTWGLAKSQLISGTLTSLVLVPMINAAAHCPTRTSDYILGAVVGIVVATRMEKKHRKFETNRDKYWSRRREIAGENKYYRRLKVVNKICAMNNITSAQVRRRM